MLRRSSRAVRAVSPSRGYGSPLSVIEVAMESDIFEPLPSYWEAARAQPRRLRCRLPYPGITRIRFEGFPQELIAERTPPAQCDYTIKLARLSKNAHARAGRSASGNRV